MIAYEIIQKSDLLKKITDPDISLPLSKDCYLSAAI